MKLFLPALVLALAAAPRARAAGALRLRQRLASWTEDLTSAVEAEVRSLRTQPPSLPRANDTAGYSPIVSHKFGRRVWWGFPNYGRDLERGLRTWPEFTEDHGHLGLTCSPLTVQEKCGMAFVCKNGVCSECEVSRDCPEAFRCQAGLHGEGGGRRFCIARDLISQWNHREVICTILIILTAMFSAAAGMGGGGVYVPLLLLLLGFSTREAVPLSQAMIVGGAVINIVMFCGDRHPKYPHRPKIDYDVIMMLNPGLAAGVTVGVICNVVSPQWLIVMTLLVTLIISLDKSVRKGLTMWQKESKLLEEQARAAKAGGGAPAKAQEGFKVADFKTFLELARDQKAPITLIFGCWASFFVVNMLKARQCTTLYWAQLVFMMGICCVFTVLGQKTIMEKAKEAASGGSAAAEGMIAWTPRTMWLYPTLSLVAGFLGGFLGIGGGIIISPLLLELGMSPEAGQATSAMFVFLSSTLATIQFIVLGRGMPQYAAWFTIWVVLATFVGQTGIDYVLRKWQRSSLIVLSVAVIIAGSLVMMSFIGIMDVLLDINRGAYMGFTPHNLCV